MLRGKKILFLPDNAEWGGSELLWSQTALELIRHGLVPLVYKRASLQIPQAILSDFNISGIQINDFVKEPINNLLNRIYKKAGLIQNNSIQIRKAIKDIAPDMIVFNQGYNFNSLYLAEHLYDLNIPFVTISHALNEHFWPNSELASRMRDYFTISKHNYFVSACNLRRTVNQLGCALENASVVRNPVYPDCYSGPLVYPSIEKGFCLAFPGRYDFKSKGQDLILDVLNEEKWRNRPLYLNFYGNGPDSDALKRLVSFRNIENVRVHSFVDPKTIWTENHALILTSRFEGLPIVIPEAMLSGRIPIVTDVSGNAELIQDNVTGFIAGGTSPKSIDDALERAWNCRFTWMEMGVSARDSIINEFEPKPEIVFAEKLIGHLK